MARIPDVTSMGRRPTSQAVRSTPRAQTPVVDTGIPDLLQVGANLFQKEADDNNKFNYLKAQTELKKRHNEAVVAIEQEEDYSQHSTMYKALMGDAYKQVRGTVQGPLSQQLGLDYEGQLSSGLAKVDLNKTRLFHADKAIELDALVEYEMNSIVADPNPVSVAESHIRIVRAIDSTPGFTPIQKEAKLTHIKQELPRRLMVNLGEEKVDEYLARFTEDGYEMGGDILDNLNPDEGLPLARKRKSIIKSDKVAVQAAKDKALIASREADLATKIKNEIELSDALEDKSTSFEQKLHQINELDVKGQIRDDYAAEARRYLNSKKAIGAITNADDMADIIVRVHDLNALADLNPTDYLIGIRDIKKEIMKKRADGELSSGDEKTLNGQIKSLTSSKVAGATSFVSYSFGEARKMFEDRLPPAQRGTAIRQFFYNTLDKQDLKGDELRDAYKVEALRVIDGINTGRREKTLSHLEKQKTDSTPTFKSMEDMEEMMKVKNAADGTIVIVNGVEGRYRK